MSTYSADQLKELQKISLNTAKYFLRFCERNHLLCYLCGGGCIGTIRNGGFIPWDDDLDFFMPRIDYEKLIELWPQQEKHGQYILEISGKDDISRCQFVNIRDRETTLIKPYQQDLDICHGVSLDVLPLDGYAPGNFHRRIQKIWALLHSLYRSQQIPERHGGLVRLGSKTLLALAPTQKLRYKIWNYAEKQMTKYRIDDPEVDSITELCSGPHYMKKKYPKDIFSSAVYQSFEDTEMPLPIGYDRYLTIAFGDYMQLPPEEKRVPHHDAVFVDLEHGYERYKGKYYCNK